MNEKIMTTKTFTCTLTRWHKVAERLNKEYSDLSKAIKSGLMETSITEYLGETHEARLVLFRDQCLQQLQRALSIQDVVTQIRQALGEANDRHGVTLELADYDKLVKRANLFNSIVDAQSTQLVTIGELKHIKNPARSEDWRDRGQTRIAVGLLEGELLNSLRKQAEEATAAQYAQADRLSYLNKSSVALDLPIDIARIAGL
jgi:uncharacterized protein YukE